MFPDVSVVILLPISVFVPSSTVNPAIVPNELYFRMKVPEEVVTGNVYPEGTSELFRAKLFILIVPVELYVPVMYMFPDVSVVILLPISLPPVPSSTVNPAIVPDELYYRTNTPGKVVVAGNVYPELTGELFRAKLFIVTGLDELY